MLSERRTWSLGRQPDRWDRWRSSGRWGAWLIGTCLVLSACGAFDELDPRLHFGTPPELPPGVAVPQDFERGGDGFATDIPAAFERFDACLEDVRVALADANLTHTYSADREMYAMLCSEAAGNGWSPGNRPDEVRLLNEQAINTTRCLQDRGWDYPDPVPESLGRFLEVHDPMAPGIVTEIEAQAVALIQDVADCVDEHAIVWSEWIIANPRS